MLKIYTERVRVKIAYSMISFACAFIVGSCSDQCGFFSTFHYDEHVGKKS